MKEQGMRVLAGEHGGAGLKGVLGRLAAGVATGLGRGGSARGERRLELLETLHLGPKRQLLVVRCGEESFLVGAGSEGVTTLVRLEAGRAADLAGEPR